MEKKLKWYHGLLAIALFGGVMALEYFGLLGRGIFTTVLGELLFVAAAVVVVLIARVALPSVFRFKRVRLLSLVGVYMMWRALITVGVFLTETAIYFFPKLGDSSDGVTDLITHLSFPMAILVIAILPAVCEEMLFRGPILRSLEFIKIPALIIIVDGLIFAAAHLSFIKMIPITLLGIYLAYLVYTSGNMFYSMFVHFVNNSLSVILVYTLLGLGGGSSAVNETAKAAATQLQIPVSALGMTLCGCTLSPILFYIGHYFFIKSEKRNQMPQIRLRKNWLFLMGAVGLLIFSLGFLLFALGFDEMMALSGM